MSDDRILMHYCVKGMKWGVRKDDRSGGTRISKSDAIKAAKKAGSTAKKVGKTAAKITHPVSYHLITTKDERRTASIAKKRARAMSVSSSARYTYKQRKYLSDAELRNRINRLNMEKQLKDLSRSDRRSPDFIMMDTGQRAARKALGTYGAKTVLTAAGYGEAAKFIKPKK